MASAVEQKRKVHYDLLRIVAAFSVVMLHSAAQFWYTLPVTDLEWKIANTYDALFRFGVPIFVMISGALFLNREVDIKRLYTHNILRLLVVYLLWSAVYGLFDVRGFDLSQIGWRDVVKEMLGGRYHLWFLPMIISIYMLLPILQCWVRNADKRNLQYFLLLFFTIKIGITTLSSLEGGSLVQYIVNFFDSSELSAVCSYIGYFVLGYYIAHIGIPRKWHKVIYGSVVPSALLNVLLDGYMAGKANMPMGVLYDCFGLFTFVIVVALFLFFTEVMGNLHYSNRAERIIREISQATLGIYVMHVGWMEFFEEVGIHSRIIPNIVGIPLLAIGIFLVCFACAALLRQIPLVGKYIC